MPEWNAMTTQMNLAAGLAQPNIVLFGPPGVGKTAVGRRLAETLDRPFVDTDERIEAESGKKIERIFAEDGEAAFREIEREIVIGLSGDSGLIVAVGGGSLLDADARQAVEGGGTVVFLDCDVDGLLARMDGADQRPLLAGSKSEALRALLAERASAYASFSTRVDTSQRDLEQVVRDVKQIVDSIPARSWNVDQSPRSYPVTLGTGTLAGLVDELAALGIAPPLVVIADSNVAPLYGERAAAMIGATLVTFPAGEASKTLEVVQQLGEACLAGGLDREGTIVSLGGGVVSDVAGFVAAVYMRGVRWVAVPTTLLAMIDASVGGKVGVDLESGKNLMGAFHPPALVLCDTSTLDSLPPEEMVSGMAELVKAAVVGDPLLFEWLEAEHARPSVRWLERALAVKISIVEHDPYEHGERAALNLGHTVGHAIERASGYRVRHGDAVSIGMVAEARMAEGLGLAETGLADRLRVVLSRVGLPTQVDHLPPGEIIRAMTADKKRRAGGARFSLPVRPGHVQTGIAVPETLVADVLRRRLE